MNLCKYFFLGLLSLLPVIAKGQSSLPCLQQSEYLSDWKFLGPFNYKNEIANQHFGAITAISVNPNDSMEIFVGAYSAGLFHTVNRGKSWECLTDNFKYPIIGVNDIWIDYQKKPYTILLTTGSKTVCDGAEFGILKSTDGGKTWSNHYLENKEVFVAAITKKIKKDEENKIFYVMGNKNIIRSFDEGETWDEIFSENQVPEIIAKKDYEILSMELSNDGSELYFTTKTSYEIDKETHQVILECDLIKIKNCNRKGGHSLYEKLTNKLNNYYLPAEGHASFALKISKPNKEVNQLVIDRTYIDNMAHSLYRFDISTQECTSYFSPNNNYFPEDIYWKAGLKISPTNPKNMYLAGNVLNKSTDSGKTFKALYEYGYGDNNVPHTDIRCYEITQYSEDTERDHIYLGTDGGLSFSSNGGKSFVNLNGESLPITQFYGLGVSPFTGTISAGSQDNSILSYLPKEKKWIYAVRGDGYDVEYSKLIPKMAYGQYNSRLMTMTQNDVAPFERGMNMEPKERASNKKTIATDKNGNVYFAEDQFNILRKNESKWERTAFDEMHETLAFAVRTSNSDIIYLSKFWHSLFKSTDGGKTFTNISDKVKIDGQIKSNTRIHAICISPTDADKVWISLGYLGNYTDACNPSPRVLYSSDGGENWIDYSEGLPVYNVSDLVFLEGTSEALFAATMEGIFFRENKNERWKLFSTNLPKCIIPEMQISYCRGKLIAATYGRGLWETDLPQVKYTEALQINKKTIWEVGEKEALYFTQDIILGKKATLTINSAVHMAKGKTIWVKNKNQIILGKNGKLLNDCGESWNGIQVKK